MFFCSSQLQPYFRHFLFQLFLRPPIPYLQYLAPRTHPWAAPLALAMTMILLWSDYSNISPSDFIVFVTPTKESLYCAAADVQTPVYLPQNP